MSDEAGAAPAAAESVAAPAHVAEEVASPPNPIDVQTQLAPEPKAEPEKKAPSTREALDKAFKTVEAKQAAEKDPKAEAKPEAKAKEPIKDDKVRDETGKFAPKDKPADSEKGASAPADKPKAEDAAPVKSTYEAPKRFSEDAKKVWDTAPDPVKAEVARMEREMSAGIEKHRAKAERDDSLAEFHEMATKTGTTVKDALSKYVGMENKLRGDLIGGLDEIISNATGGKTSLRDVAAHIMEQTPEQSQSQSEATIRELKHTVAQLKEQIGGVTQTIEQRQKQEAERAESETLNKITAWSADKPLFELLAPHIADHMRESGDTDLDSAYKAVLQKHPQLVALSPGKKPEPDASSAPAVADLAEQIRKGSKSPTGAPAPGSDPATRRPSKSNREALDRAFASIG